MDDFYIVLPSNTPVEGNTTSSFKVRLPEQVNFQDSNWTVALSSIIYPHSFSSAEQHIDIHFVGEKMVRVPVGAVSFDSIKGMEKTLNGIVSTYFTQLFESQGIRPKREAAVKEITAEEKQKKIEVATRAINTALNRTKQHKDYVEAFSSYLEKLKQSVEGIVGHEEQKQKVLDRLQKIKENQRLIAAQWEKIVSEKKAPNTLKELVSARRAADHAKKAEREALRLRQEISDWYFGTEANQKLDGLQEMVKKLSSSSTTTTDAPVTQQSTATQEIVSVDEPKDDNPQKAEFQFNELTQRFFVKLAGDVKYIELTDELSYILGYRKPEIYHLLRAEYMPVVTGAIQQLYVYAPKLVENTIVGDVLAPLLRVVHVQGAPGSIQETIYTNEFHLRIAVRHITEINIEILTDTGEPVKFSWGNCILVLHFKR